MVSVPPGAGTLADAVIVTGCGPSKRVSSTPVTGKLTDASPGEMVTVAGTVSSVVSLLVRVTVRGALRSPVRAPVRARNR